MTEDDRLPFLEAIRTYNWQLLASLLKKAGPKRARQLVTSIVDQDDHATALTFCARSSTPSSSSSSHHHHHTHSTLHPPTEDGKEDRGRGGGGGRGLLETCQVLVNYGADLNHRDRGGRTALHWAVENHKTTLAAMLVSMGADVHLANRRGFTALHTAVCASSLGCVQLLLQHDSQLLEEKDSQGTPPLTLAVQKGQSDLCRYLLQVGADVTAQESQTLRTPLHYALYLNHLHVFVLLLSYKPNLRLVDHRGTTIVHRSCAARDSRYLLHVLSSGCDHVTDVINMEDKEGATPIIIACQSNSLPNVQLLLESGANVSARDIHGRTALHHCVENTDTECAELLLKTDPSLLSTADHEGLSPLHMAVIAGNVPLIRLLLKRGASLQCKDQEEHTVAHWATVCGHSRVLDVLLEYGAELSLSDKHQAYPLHYAAQMMRQPGEGDNDDDRFYYPGDNASQGGGEDADTPASPRSSRRPRDQNPSSSPPSDSSQSGHARLLRKLLDSGVSPEVRDKDGRTPVIWAASAGNSNACQILVEAGVDVNSTDNDGLSALHCAASRGHSECVRMLVDTCGACVDPVDRNECTPLFYATTLGHDDCVKILLDLGASPSHTDSRGRTTAHCAAVTGSRDSLEALRKQGVDLWQPTDKGDYPIHEAAQAGHVEAIGYLLEIAEGAEKDRTINTANRDGRTCLHIAALTNDLWLAKFLLDHNADVNAVMRNKGRKYSPYDAAVAKGNKEAADYLQSRGGRPVSSKRPSSSKSKDRPSSSRSKDRAADDKVDGRPSSGKDQDRPTSGASEDRPSSGKVKDRTASGKVKDRPTSGASEDRPSSSKSKDRPASSKSKDRPSSEDRPASSKSKDRPSSEDRPASSKSKDASVSSKGEERPSSGKVKDRPASGKVKDRPASSKSKDSKAEERPSSGEVKDRPASGKVEDRPASGKVKDRPASGKVKDRPASGKVKDRPASGKLQESKEAESQQQTDEEVTGGTEETTEDQPVLAVVVTHADRPRSSSPSRKTPSSPKRKDSDHSSSDEGRARPSSRDSKAAAKHADGRHVKLDTGKEEAQSEKDDEYGVVYIDKKSSSEHEQRPSSPAKPKEQTDSEHRTPSRQQSPKHAHSNVSFKTPEPDCKDVSVKKDDSEKKTVRVSDTTKEHSSTTGSKNLNKKTTVHKSASANRGRNPHKNTQPSRQNHPKSQQKQTRRSRSHSSSRSSSRSQRSSSLESCSSDMSAKKHGKSKGKDKDGDGLNLFSDSSDHEDEAIPARHKKRDEASTKRSEGKSGHEEDDAPDSSRDQKKRPGSGRLVASVQDSVRRYEQVRRSIRQLQQLRRAEIYANHCRNVALFHSLLRVYGTPNGAHTWDHILQDQHKQTRDMEQHRSKGGAKSSARGENKGTAATGTTKDGPDHNHVNGDKDSLNENTTTDRRQNSAASAKGNGHSSAKEDAEREEYNDSSPPRSPSPRRYKHYDYGDPMYYRQIQRQRTEDMHRKLLKAYRPALPQDLFLNGKPQDKPPTSSLHPRPSRPSTSKSLPPRPLPSQGRPTSMTSTGSSQGRSSPNAGLSKAQFQAVQKSYTIMTPYGTRRIRPRSAHPTTWSQTGHHASCSKRRIGSANCSTDHRDRGVSTDRGQHNHDGITTTNHRQP